MAKLDRLPYHARSHRPPGTYGPDDPGGSDPFTFPLVTSGGAFETYRDCVLARPSLTHFWPCDDASGNLIDLVGGTNLTPVTNAGYPVYGQPGPFLALPDETAVANAAATQARFENLPASIGGTTAYSIEVWVYPTSAANGIIYDKWDGSIGQQVSLLVSGAGTVFGFVRGGASITGGTVTVNAWTLLRATFTGTAINLYQDDMDTPIATTATSSSLTAQGAGSFLNNRNTGGTGFQPFVGRAADLSLYSTAITGDCTLGPDGGTDNAEFTVMSADGVGGIVSPWPYPTIEVEF